MDPDPVVIRNLLKNPRLLERDVLRIASAQPVAADVISEIFEATIGVVVHLYSSRCFKIHTRHPIWLAR